MAALRVPPDDVDRGAAAAEPAVRVRGAGVDGGDHLPRHRRRRHLLLVQPHLPRPGAPRAAGPPPAPLQGHGHRHPRSVRYCTHTYTASLLLHRITLFTPCTAHN
jgi:hypothetical protein